MATFPGTLDELKELAEQQPVSPAVRQAQEFLERAGEREDQ